MKTNCVKEFREKAGLTQVELARRARIASPNLSSIERGRLVAWPRVRRALARALKTTPEKLLKSDFMQNLKIIIKSII